MKHFNVLFLAENHAYEREEIFGRLTKHILLFDKEHPAYTFAHRSGGRAFYQPYLIRGKEMVLQ